MATRTVKPTKGQRVVFFLMVICTIPFSLVYLALWRGRCAYCGKRIFFNRRVCKKCDTRAHEIVDNFDEKIEMFYQQMGVIDDITDIISQYEYVVNQFQGINDIYEALDEEVDTKSMEEKTMVNLHRTLEDWIQNRHREFYSLGQSKVPKFSISTDVVDFFYFNFFKIFRCICCMLL